MIDDIAHFGACPYCGDEGLWFHAEDKTHWVVCEAHGVRWSPGRNLLSIPDGYDYASAQSEIANHRSVEPIYFKSTAKAVLA